MSLDRAEYRRLSHSYFASRLVQTELDPIDFPTLCWFETDYSVFVMRQTSRRAWLIGQRRPVKVVFMAYRNSPTSRRMEAGGQEAA